MMNTWLMRRPVRRPSRARRPRRAARRCAGCPSSGARPRPCGPARPPCAAARMAVRRVDDRGVRRDRCPLLRRSPAIFAAGPTRIGAISPFAPASTAPAERRCLARMRDGGRDRRRGCRHRSSSCSYFPVPVVWSHRVASSRGAGASWRTAGPVSLRKKREHDREARPRRAAARMPSGSARDSSARRRR